MKTVLAVFAHPDDETFICGGTLARLAEEAHNVKLICATKGEMGRRMGIPPVATRESIGEMRELELAKAAKALGISSVEYLGIRDKSLEIYPYSLFLERMKALFDEIRPDVVITFHEEFGGHPDHCTVGKVATAAFHQYRVEHPRAELYFVAWARMLTALKESGRFESDFVQVDVRSTRKQKLAAYRAHETQSNLLDFVWKSDDRAISGLPSYEYFVLDSTTASKNSSPMLGMAAQ